jgi:hypothetical protein
MIEFEQYQRRLTTFCSDAHFARMIVCAGAVFQAGDFAEVCEKAEEKT